MKKGGRSVKRNERPLSVVLERATDGRVRLRNHDAVPHTFAAGSQDTAANRCGPPHRQAKRPAATCPRQTVRRSVKANLPVSTARCVSQCHRPYQSENIAICDACLSTALDGSQNSFENAASLVRCGY